MQEGITSNARIPDEIIAIVDMDLVKVTKFLKNLGNQWNHINLENIQSEIFTSKPNEVKVNRIMSSFLFLASIFCFK